jgi:hypothetical protein
MKKPTQAEALGCVEFMEGARDCGATSDDMAVAMDKLEESGVDGCIEFLTQVTNGRYPPNQGLLLKAPPKIYTHQKGGRSHVARRATFWDSFEFNNGTPIQPYLRLFGNENVGHRLATNLQVAGNLGNYDSATYVGGWHVASNVSEEGKPYLLDLLSDSLVTFIMGDKPQGERHMAQLFEEAKPLEVLVPPRQWVSVDVSMLGVADFERWRQAKYRRPVAGGTVRDEIRVWVIFEGWTLHSVGHGGSFR